MNKKRMDVYPWAVPTAEQKRLFDALSYEEQLEMVRQALIEGEENGPGKDFDADRIIRKARQRVS